MPPSSSACKAACKTNNRVSNTRKSYRPCSSNFLILHGHRRENKSKRFYVAVKSHLKYWCSKKLSAAINMLENLWIRHHWDACEQDPKTKRDLKYVQYCVAPWNSLIATVCADILSRWDPRGQSTNSENRFLFIFFAIVLEHGHFMLYLGRERHLLSNSAVVKAHATMFRIGGRESKITKVRLEPFTKTFREKAVKMLSKQRKTI